MANYTIELGKLIENGYVLNLNKYPIFDESYRNILNKKIIEHFYFREIGQETPDRFNFCLGRTMNEIMPYYNKLYESELIEFNPLITEYHKEERTETTDSIKNNYTAFGKQLSQTVGNVESSISKSDLENNFTSDKTNDTTENYTKTGSKTTDSTENKKENLVENGNIDKTTTNDLTEGTNSIRTEDKTGSRTENKNSVFSDVPQSNLSINNDNGLTVDGYATTVTHDSTNENTTDNTEITEDSKKTNTGTVKEDETNKKINNNTIGSVGTVKENWNENGNTIQNSTGNETNKTTNTETIKSDSEQNTATNENEKTHGKTKEKQNEISKTINEIFGRNSNPSELIVSFRSTFLNIDMQIINELNNLFMGVF